MRKSYRSELVGVFGYPVDENPIIVPEEAAFAAMGLNFRYLTVEVRPEGLHDALKALHAMNMKGINLTIPHKCEAIQYLDELSTAAEIIGAVNTVIVRDGKLYGENTDGKGFLTSLKEEGVAIEGKRVVVLGAGGAARSIAVELALAGAGHITIVNRSEKNAKELAALICGRTATEASYELWTEKHAIAPQTDILVNATPIGLYPHTDEKPDIDYGTVQSSMTVCDVITNHPHTLFLKEAERKGAKTINGLGMLVNQGAINFTLWTGVKAPVEVMTEAIRKEFGL